MAHDVFISHSAKNKTTADAVCAILESNGIRCWIAPRDVTAGMEWGECIIEAIEQSRIMVLVFTAEANASSQIRREIERAVNRGVAILPLRVENVIPSRGLEYFIGNLHWLDALTPPLEAHLLNLADTVKRLLNRTDLRDLSRTQPAADASSKSERVDPAHAVADKAPHAAGISTSASSSLKTPSTVHSDVSPAGAKKTASTRKSSRIIFAGAGLIALLVALYFLMPTLRKIFSRSWVQDDSGTQVQFESMFGTSDGKHLWVVGDKGTILYSEDGTHWVEQDSGTQSRLNSIIGTSDAKKLWAVGDQGTIVESVDGQHWTKPTSPTANELWCIFGSGDGSHLWAVGKYGTIVRSIDGENWTQSTSGTQIELYSVFGTTDGKRLWAVGLGGTILESDDGTHWNPRTSGTSDGLYSIFGKSDGSHLWVVGLGGTILGSANGGLWTPLHSDTQDRLFKISGSSDAKRLWVVGDQGTILESTDGEHWLEHKSGTSTALYSIFETNDGSRAWAAGAGGIILESDTTGH